MKQLIATLEAQIKNCKSLLSVFQDERKLYQEKGQATQRDVNDIIKRKKQVMEVFDNQQSLMRDLQTSKEAAESADKLALERRRLLIRELAGVLEQLLVIDQENEKLLRHLSSSNKPAIQSQMAGSMARQRPALQTRLPFMPNHSAATAIGPVSIPAKAAAPVAAAIPAAASSARPAPAKNPNPVLSNAAPRSQLRHYAEAAQLMQLTSKYA